MNQLEFEVTNAGSSQADKILGMLQAAGGGWVPMPNLHWASGSLNVHSRIADLRKRGRVIEQKTERTDAGTNNSFYKLTSP